MQRGRVDVRFANATLIGYGSVRVGGPDVDARLLSLLRSLQLHMRLPNPARVASQVAKCQPRVWSICVDGWAVSWRAKSLGFP